jgi:hypothetical protein
MVSSLLAGIRFPSLINEGLDARGTDPNENADPPQKPGRKLIGMPAGFISEWWPASNRNGGRLHVGIPGRNKSESARRRYAEWTPDRFRRWGRSIGPNTEGLVLAILANRPHPEQGFRTCLGVLRLFKDVDPERAELIAARAVAVSALTYKSIASIIANKLERSSRDTDDAIIEHPNLRGPGYFH